MSARGEKPLLGITMGDPTGAGPEIAVKALCSGEVRDASRPIIVGDTAAMRAAVEIVKLPAEVRTIQDVGQAEFGKEDVIHVVDLHNVDMQALVRGRVHPMGGKAAYEYVEAATRLALSGAIDAVVTGPLNKEALNRAGYEFSGHTEILAHLCGVTDVVMMLGAGGFRVSHVNTHV
jgi:4-hydroxythreonine-4-phosphate dehydrogenase